MQSSRVEYAWKIPRVTWFFLEKPFENYSLKFFFAQSCRRLKPVLTFLDSCERGQTEILQVQLLVWWGSSFHNFGAAELKGLSLNPEKRFTLEKYQYAARSIEIKLNLVRTKSHWVAWKVTTVVICYNNNNINGICGNIYTLWIIYRFSQG